MVDYNAKYIFLIPIETVGGLLKNCSCQRFIQSMANLAGKMTLLKLIKSWKQLSVIYNVYLVSLMSDICSRNYDD